MSNHGEPDFDPVKELGWVVFGLALAFCIAASMGWIVYV